MTEASLKQGKQVLDLLGDLSTEEVQNLIERGDLVKMLARANKAWLDRDTLLSQLRPPTPVSGYSPVSSYVERIMARAKVRGWKLTQQHTDSLSAQLQGHDHTGPLAPVGASMWLGNLDFTWSELFLWLEDEARDQGLEYYQYFTSTPTFYSGSKQAGDPFLKAVGFDLSLWDPQNGVVPKEERKKAGRQYHWPSLEVPLLLCLNPGLMKVMDGTSFPFLMAPGLVVDSDYLPFFYRSGRELYVHHGWADRQWHYAAVVRFREL